MSQKLWELNRFEGKNPTHTGSFLTSYDSREFTPEEVVAREGGQNAIDAGQGINKATRLIFQKLRAESKAKDDFLDLFGFKDMLAPRIDAFAKSDRNKMLVDNMRSFLFDPSLSVLLIRDYETCGLGGDWESYEPDDHFGRLVCALNLDDKSDGDSSRGGSFGLGKTAYAKSSSINTVIYHSVFAETDRTQGAHRRLMATGVYPKHELEDKSFGGFAYFGEDKGDGEVKPFENEEAEGVWDEVGKLFGHDLTRDKSQTGTDILILMDSVNLDSVKRAVEEFYFPAIIGGKLNVEFIGEDGTPDYPKPYEREDLDQFVRLYKLALNGVDKNEDTLISEALRKKGSLKVGRIAFQGAEPDEAKSSRSNCVAITRGTGMILNYIKLGSDKYEPAVGIYLADDDVVPYLNISENAAHSEWSEHSRRLDQRYPNKGPEIVRSINSVIQNRFSQFQKALQPDVSSSRSENGYFARLLAGALTGSKGENKPTKEQPNPVSIHLVRDKRDEDVSVWHLKVVQNEYTPAEPFDLTLRPSISLAGDAKKVAIKHMNILVKTRDGKIVSKGDKPEIAASFEPGVVLEYLVQFPNPGRRNYVVQCRFEASMEVEDV